MYIADTLRFEMYPFNVKVINICTGGVKSQIAKKATQNYNLVLPSDSVYLPIEEQVKTAQDNRAEGFLDAKKYAEYVVTKVNKASKSARIWKGAFSNTIWFVTTFISRSVFDSIQLKENGLKELKRVAGKRGSE
jgi:1-acylglycerone phosphate reductase